jgi:hypothetical protein
MGILPGNLALAIHNECLAPGSQERMGDLTFGFFGSGAVNERPKNQKAGQHIRRIPITLPIHNGRFLLEPLLRGFVVFELA